MPKNTPGPWEVRKDIVKETLVCSEEDKRIICGIHQKNLNRLEETEANAKLIAAAPELLEAAKEVKEWWDRTYPEDVFISEDEVIRLRSLLKEAIKKAEGDNDGKD